MCNTGVQKIAQSCYARGPEFLVTIQGSTYGAESEKIEFSGRTRLIGKIAISLAEELWKQPGPTSGGDLRSESTMVMSIRNSSARPKARQTYRIRMTDQVG